MLLLLKGFTAGAPAVARALLLLARVARRGVNLALKHKGFWNMAYDNIGRISGLTRRLVRYGAISPRDAALIVSSELVRPASALPKHAFAAACGVPEDAGVLPGMAFSNLLQRICVVARDPAALLILRRHLAAAKDVCTGEPLNREYASGFVMMMKTDFPLPSLWGWGALAFGQTKDM